MRKLKLSITTLDSQEELPYKYSINLHNRKILYFKSKRKAEDFIRDLSSFVSDTIRSCYDIHVQLYSMYLHHSFTIKPYSLNQIKLRLDGFLNIIEKWSRDYGEGWQSLALSGFFKILNHVEDTSLEFISYFKKSNDYFHVNKVNAHLQMIYFFYEKYDQIFKRIEANLNYKTKTVKVLDLKRKIS